MTEYAVKSLIEVHSSVWDADFQSNFPKNHASYKAHPRIKLVLRYAEASGFAFAISSEFLVVRLQLIVFDPTFILSGNTTLASKF